ncbi:MAG: ABC transporter permease [Candidatus Cyclobacteriaceae bacterium M3_2C_046]
MIKNYFKTALRNFQKEKLYTAINILGLSLGFTICFLIYFWIVHEVSYDKFHQDAEHIYRINTKVIGNDEEGLATTYPVVKTMILDQIPEITASVRLFNQGLLGSTVKVAYQDKVFTNNDLFYADPSFFKVFSFTLLQGNRSTALNRPNSIVITQSTARKYFGNENPIGKILKVGQDMDYEVTGVMENIPTNSHFSFDLLATMHSHPWIDKVTSYGSGVVFATYVKINSRTSPSLVKQKIDDILYDELPGSEEYRKSQNLVLQPLTDIHLKSDYKFELAANGDLKYVYLFTGIVMLVLVIAGINYINLTTARAIRRAREVGVRKVLGALKKQLIFQFLIESVLISTLAAALSLLLIELAKQPFYQITGKSNLVEVFNDHNYLIILMVAAGIGLVAGAFPALMLSGYQPIKVLKGKPDQSNGKFSFRKGLVVFQFAISMVLLVATLVVYLQLNYMQQAKLGYDKEHVIVLHIGYDNLQEKQELLKTVLLESPSLINASAVSQLPANIITMEGVNYTEEKRLECYTISVDRDFFKTMNINLVAGQDNLDHLIPEQYQNKYVVNESFLKSLNMNEKDIMGQEILVRHGNMEWGPVIGVAQDFHFQSLHHPINHLVFEFDQALYEYMLIKVNADHLKESLAHIETSWGKVAGNLPFDYQFLDQEYNRLYHNEQRVSNLFIAFALVAIVIASLGLFGLSSFAVQRRTKEIGIRKVFGASVMQVIRLLSHDFILLIILAFLIAAPMGYLLMNKWLENFAYKIHLDLTVLLISGFFAFMIAVVTVGYHAYKTAHSNPALTLRDE